MIDLTPPRYGRVGRGNLASKGIFAIDGGSWCIEDVFQPDDCHFIIEKVNFLGCGNVWPFFWLFGIELDKQWFTFHVF